MAIETHKLIKNTTIYAAGDIVPRLLAFASLPILGNYLSTEQYGVVSYVNALLLVLSIVGYLSLNTYYLVFYGRQKDDQARGKLLGNLTFFVGGVNVIFVVLMLIFGPWFFELIGSSIDFYPYLALAVLTHLANTFAVFPSALYRMQERPLLFTVLNSAKGVLQLGVMALLVVGFSWQAQGVLWANLIVAAIFAVVFVMLTRRETIFCINWAQIRVALRFSLPLLPGAIAYYLILMFDRVLIDHFLGLNDVGIYSMAANLAMVLNILSYGAYKAFEPHFFKIYGTADFGQHFAKVRDAFVFVMLVGVTGLSLFGREFFQLMTSAAYSTSYLYVPLILIGVYAAGLAMLYNTIVTARGKTHIISGVNIVGAIVSVALNVWLLPRWGVVAAPLASGSALVVILLLDIHYSGLRVKHGNVIGASLFAGLVIWIAVYLLPMEGFWLPLAIKGVIFVVTNLITMRILGLTFSSIYRSIVPKANP
ncbi:MAG: oligosaccharide flippase family protein [Mucinivorans sp.]